MFLLLEFAGKRPIYHQESGELTSGTTSFLIELKTAKDVTE
jgi:hypothetical protein